MMRYVSGSIRIHTNTLFTNFYRCDWPENPRKLRESSAEDPRRPWLAGMAPPFDRGVAVPTDIWRSRCLAVPTDIWRTQLGPGSDHWDLELVVEGGRTRRWRRRRRRKRRWAVCSLIKLRDSHMAGWEHMFQYVFAREHRGFFSGFSAKARESAFRTHGCRERKNATSRKVRERDGKREDRIERKLSGFQQPLMWRSWGQQMKDDKSRSSALFYARRTAQTIEKFKPPR